MFAGLLALFTFSFALFFLAVLKAPASNTLIYEGAKTLPQIGLVSVAGAILSYLVFEYQQAQQRADRQAIDNAKSAEERGALLRATLSVLATTYSDLKRIRRLMRAQGLGPEPAERAVIVTKYDEYMEEVITNQLRLEQVTQDVISASEAFADPEYCVLALRKIDRGLHSIIAEYEHQRPLISGATCPLEKLPWFRAFLATGADEPELYRTGFYPITKNLWDLRRVVRGDLLRLAGIDASEQARQKLMSLAQWRY